MTQCDNRDHTYIDHDSVKVINSHADKLI